MKGVGPFIEEEGLSNRDGCVDAGFAGVIWAGALWRLLGLEVAAGNVGAVAVDLELVILHAFVGSMLVSVYVCWVVVVGRD